MVAPSIFHQWVPNALRIPTLIFLFFVVLDFNGVYQGNTIDIYSDLGIYAETYTSAYNAVYIGFGLGFLIHMRLAARFPVKTLILWGFSVQLLMNAVCAICPYPILTIMACLILGFCKVAATKELYNFWSAIWSNHGDRGRIYPFVFTLALAGGFFMFWAMEKLAFAYNWQYAYVAVIAAMLLAILLVLLLFEYHPLHRPLPLYQMDYTGVALLALFMMLINYLGTYGQVEDWFNSPRIKIAIALLPVTALAFALREASVRRPVFPLHLFRTPNYIPGLLLFLTTGLYFPATLQFFYSANVLHYELPRVLELNLYLIPGVLIGAVLAGLWYLYNLPKIYLICIGMTTCLVYNILFYRHLTGAEGLQDFWLPSIFKGIGIVILYISLGIQTTYKAPPQYAVTVLGFMIVIRSFLARGLFTAGFTYLIYSQRIHHLNAIAEWLDHGFRYRWNGGTNAGSYTSFVQRQAYLGAAAEITGWVVIVGGAIVIALLAWSVIRRYKGLVICLTVTTACLIAKNTSAQQKPVLTRSQQAVLQEQAGAFFYVTKYATIDLDSSILVASHSLGISLLPLITEAIPEEPQPKLTEWIEKNNPTEAKIGLPTLDAKAHLQQLYLLGSWYAFQSTAHQDLIDSAIGYLKKARNEAHTLNAKPWAARAACMLGKAYLAKQDTCEGNSWFYTAIEECNETNDLKGAAMAWRYWGVYYLYLPSVAPQRIGHLMRADSIYSRIKDGYSRINTQMHTGFQEYSLVHFKDAIQRFQTAMQIEDSLSWPYAHYTTDLLALAALEETHYGDMCRYALRSIKTSEYTQDSLCWPVFYLRMAAVYDGPELFRSNQIFWLQKAIDRLMLSHGELQVYQYASSLAGILIDSRRGDEIPALVAMITRRYPPQSALDSMSYHVILADYAAYKNDRKAEMRNALLASADIKRAVVVRPFMNGAAEFVMGLAYFNSGEYAKAENMLRAVIKSNWLYSPEQITATYRCLMRIDTLKGNAIAEVSDFNHFWKIDSTLNSNIQAQQVDILSVQYEVAEREKNIQLLQTQTQLQKHELQQASLIRGFGIAGIILLLAVLALLYNRYRLKRRTNLQLDSLLATKEWLMKELHHRVKNNLQIMMSLQNMQAHTLTNEEAVNAITESNNRLRAMSLIHQKLYQPDSGGMIDMEQYVNELVLNLTEAFSDERTIRIETRTAKIQLHVSQAIPVGLILNEAITNALKYAFTNRPADLPDPYIGISLEPAGNGTLEVLIRDNGKGYFPKAQQGTRASLGFSLIEILAEQVEGSLAVYNEGGFHIRLRFQATYQSAPAHAAASWIPASS